MKKKVLYGVFMALFTFAAIGTLQSCKDDVSDLRTQTDYNLDVLKSQLEQLRSDLQSQINQNKSDIAQNASDIDANSQLIAANTSAINQLKLDLADYAKINWVLQLLGGKNPESGIAEKIINEGGLYAIIQGALNGIDGINKDLYGSVDGVTCTPENATAGSIYGRLKAAEQAIILINENLTELNKIKDDYKAAFTDSDFKNLVELVAKVKDLDSRLQTIETKVQTLETNYTTLSTDLQNLLDEVVALEVSFADFLKTNVTGILIQGTDNPVFGNFSLPIGIKSNMLFGWYGKSEVARDYNFPTANDAVSADGNTINADALALLAPSKTVAIAKGAILGAQKTVGEGADATTGISLGTLYLTLNPTNVDLSGKKLSIENSQGTKLMDIVPVKSDKLLSFGVSRAEDKASNGFYECEVLMPADEKVIEENYKINIDEGLKTAAKNALKDPSKSSALGLLKAIYDQMHGGLTAYAVRYDWTNSYRTYDSEKKEFTASSVATAVLSQYDLAVNTAKPLGYNFLAEKSSSRTLPTFGSIDNFLNSLKDNALDKFVLTNARINVDGKDIYFKALDEGNIIFEKGKSEYKVKVTIKGLMVGDTELKDIVSEMNPFDDSSTLWDKVNEAIVAKVYSALRPGEEVYEDTVLTAELRAKVTAMLLKQQQQIEDVIDSVKGAVSNMADDIFGKFTSYSDRLQKLVDLYNKVAGKINNVLADPNAYLQVAAFYSTKNGGVNVVSSDKNQPTPFDGTEFNLYLSSYTGEILAPAYKKYVAITAIDGKTNGIKAANDKCEDLNTVLDGERIKVSVKLESGKQYEFTYQAVDYTGRTSTRKFYIKVK